MITGATQLGDDRLLLTVDHDPTAVATDCFAGSIIVFVPSGQVFFKKDDGATTNVTANVNVRNNLTAAVNPAAANDSTQFYTIGSMWVNTATGTVFFATDVSAGAAIWRRSAPTITPFPFGNTVAVPAGGTLQLQGPGQSLNGFRVYRAGTITAGSIAVNVASANAYDLQIRVNGVSVATVALAAGLTSASSVVLTAAVVVGDIVTTFLVRTAGAGASGFAEEYAVVEITVS